MSPASVSAAPPSISVDPADGSIRIQGCDLLVGAGLSKAEALTRLSKFLHSQIDHKNGYEWLNLRGISFGGYPAGLSLCFFDGRLQELRFGAGLSDESRGKWPTRDAIDRQVSFVLAELRKQLARPFVSSSEHFPWGIAWSAFDEKGYVASSGLRYKGNTQS